MLKRPIKEARAEAGEEMRISAHFFARELRKGDSPTKNKTTQIAA